MPPPNLPFWHVDCSEQKAIKNQETQEKLFYLSLNCLKELYRGPVPESLGERNGNPLQYSCLENSRDRGAWFAIVRGVAKSGSDWATNTVPERAITRDSFFFFFIRKTYLHGIANICLPIICSSHLLSCLHPLWSPRPLLPTP